MKASIIRKGCLALIGVMAVTAAAVNASAQEGNVYAVLDLDAADGGGNAVYGIYTTVSNNLSTLVLNVQFDGVVTGEGTLILTDNSCFDLSSMIWNDNDTATVYLGRSGERTGYSSTQSARVADITIPAAGTVTATVTSAQCAGMYDLSKPAAKGTVMLPLSSVSVDVKERMEIVYPCSIDAYDGTDAVITASEDTQGTLIAAAYSNGRLTSVKRKNIRLRQGSNSIFDYSAEMTPAADNVRLMLWKDNEPLAESVELSAEALADSQ